VTLGKLDKEMLLEFKALWKEKDAYTNNKFKIEDKHDDYIDNDDRDNNDNDENLPMNKIMVSNINDFYDDNDTDNHDPNTDICDPNTDIRDTYTDSRNLNTDIQINDVSSSSSKSPGKGMRQSQEMSQYSEYDSFYHCDSDDDDLCPDKDLPVANAAVVVKIDIEEKRRGTIMTHDKNGRKIIFEKTKKKTEKLNKITSSNNNDDNDIDNGNNNCNNDDKNKMNMQSITNLRLFGNELLLRTYVLDPNYENKDENRSLNSPSYTNGETLTILPVSNYIIMYLFFAYLYICINFLIYVMSMWISPKKTNISNQTDSKLPENNSTPTTYL
jgi:hypothetical protein